MFKEYKEPGEVIKEIPQQDQTIELSVIDSNLQDYKAALAEAKADFEKNPNLKVEFEGMIERLEKDIEELENGRN